MKKLSKKERERIDEIIRRLIERYGGESRTYLEHNNAWQLLFATILSAQCTDARVNIVTKELFKAAPTAKEMNTLTIKEIEKYIASCGLYKTKAKNIKGLAEMVMDKYNGEIPDTMEELVKLPGIGRKSANVVMLEAFHNPQGVAIDTHAKRICNRIGISKEESPEKIEQDLLKKIDKDEYFDANHLCVWHGRYTCKARKPECEKCTITKYCNYFKIKNK